MDPERQPLLQPAVRHRRFRPLTYEEVVQSRQEVSWRRARFCLVLMFWAIIAMFISMIVSLVVTAPRCNMFDSQPSVPPVHLTLAPLVSFGRSKYDALKEYEYKPETRGDKIFERSSAPT